MNAHVCVCLYEDDKKRDTDNESEKNSLSWTENWMCVCDIFYYHTQTRLARDLWENILYI